MIQLKISHLKFIIKKTLQHHIHLLFNVYNQHVFNIDKALIDPFIMLYFSGVLCFTIKKKNITENLNEK